MLGLGLAISLMQALFLLLVCDEARSPTLGLHGTLPCPTSSCNLQSSCGAAHLAASASPRLLCFAWHVATQQSPPLLCP